MPQADMTTLQGAVTVGGFAADFVSMELTGNNSVEEVTPYSPTILMAKRRGSGTPMQDIVAAGFLLTGASNTAPPLVGTGTNTVGPFAATGCACVFQMANGCTETGNYVGSNMRVSHARMRAAVGFSLTMHNADDITQAYVTS